MPLRGLHSRNCPKETMDDRQKLAFFSISRGPAVEDEKLVRFSALLFVHRFAARYALQWCSVHTGCLNAVVSIGSFRKRLPVAAKIALVTAGTMAEVPGSPIPPGGSKLWTMWISIAGASFMRSIW